MLLIAISKWLRKKYNQFVTIIEILYNSRWWQAKEVVISAITQKTRKIIDTVRKITYCTECQKKKAKEMIPKRQL